MPLNDTRIKQAKPKGKPYKLVDGEGLVLLVSLNGSKLWRRRLRVNGVETMYAIGKYPEVGLAEAREESRRALKLAKQGINPAIHRRAAHARNTVSQAATFEAMSVSWLLHKTKEWTSATLRQRKSLLDQYILPKLGDFPAAEVKSPVVKAVLDAIHKAAPSQTGFARHIISGVMGEAIIAGLTDTDPVYVLRNRHKAPKTKHHRPLLAKEVRPFFADLDAAPVQEPTRIAVWLAFWTLCRSKEVIGAKWTEFDLGEGTWKIPEDRMKKREAHEVPLPTQAVAALKRLRAFYTDRAYLFPNAHDPRRPASHTFLNKVVTRRGLDGFTAHGIRSTGSTMLHDMGYRHEVVEQQLAHLERSKTARSYNRAQYLEERRPMMQSWADYLDGLRAGANVTSIKKAAA